MTVGTATSETAASAGQHLLCPACGYDLRATTAGRCSECGLELDREAFQRSAIAWAYRTRIGRLAAFGRTVWQFTSDTPAIRYDYAKPQSARDAAVFRRWVGVLVGMCLMVPVVLIYRLGGLREMAVAPGSAFGAAWGARGMLPGWAQDAVVPWSAGITLPYALFAYALLIAAYTVSAPGAVLRSKRLPPDQAENVRAIGIYASAPLVWLAVSAAVFLAAYLPTLKPGSRFGNSIASTVLTGIWFFVGVLSIGFTVYRTGRWRARTTHGGHPTGVVGMGELLLRWVVGIGVIVYLIPWCVGLVFIQLDALFG
jgi:hypothetical protein